MPSEHLANAETLSSIYYKRAILKEFSGKHAPIPPNSAQQYHIYIFMASRGNVLITQIFKYIFLIENIRKMYSKLTKLHKKQTFWGVSSNTHKYLNIVRSNRKSMFFIKKMNTFTYFFKILSKNTPKRTKLYHLKIFSGETCSRTPYSRYANTSTSPPPHMKS